MRIFRISLGGIKRRARRRPIAPRIVSGARMRWRLGRPGVAALLRSRARDARQGMGALMISSTADLVAGLTLGSMTGVLKTYPGLILLVPAAIGMRGNIFGALGSRLGTAIHTGEFSGRLSARSVGGQSVLASAALTLEVSVALAFVARGVGGLFGVETISTLDYLVVSVMGGVLSSVLVMAITVAVAALSVRRGWDMDNVSAPVVTAAGDLVTLPALWLATFALPLRFLPQAIGLLSIAAFFMAIVYTVRHPGLKTFRRIVRQSLPILIVAALVDVIAGLSVDRRIEDFFALPTLLVLLPLFLQNAGALGGILSARLASKLHLGSISPRAVPTGRGVEDIVLTYLLAIPVFALVGTSATLSSGLLGLSHPGLLPIVGLCLLAGAMAITGGVFIAYYAAILSYRFGLDPDTYGIPAVTSSMDLIGALAVIASLGILNIAG